MRAHHHQAARRRATTIARDYVGRRRGRRQHLRVPEFGQAGEPRRHRRGHGRERPRHRHRLLRRRRRRAFAAPIRACSPSPVRTSTSRSSAAVHEAVPPLHDPYIDLVPPEGLRLTPRHYAYLKISEGCNNRCSFCIIPALRGDLVSRPASHVHDRGRAAREGRRQGDAGHQPGHERYGLDIKYAESLWKGAPLKARFLDLVARAWRSRRLGPAALRLSLSACRRGDPADGGWQDPALSRHPLPACLAASAESDAASGASGKDRRTASAAGATFARTSQSARPSSSAFPARRKRISSSCSTGWARPRSIAPAASSTSRSKARKANALGRRRA